MENVTIILEPCILCSWYGCKEECCQPDEKTLIFIKKARKIHGYKYDYHKFVYGKSATLGTMICIDHGEFPQSSNSHLCGSGCPDCGRKSTAQKQTRTLEEFIRLAIEIHGNKYNYIKFIYVNKKRLIIIECPIHGEFKQSTTKHLCGQGCRKCGTIATTQKRTRIPKEFIRLAIEIHGNKYNYVKFIYVGAKIKGIIICPDHGEFLQTPDDHLRGRGCSKCGRIATTRKQTRTLEEFIRLAIEIHGNNYDYHKFIYVNAKIKSIIICTVCGEFLQTPDDHLNGRHGCPNCRYKTEKLIHKYLKSLYPGMVKMQCRFNWCRNLNNFYKKRLPFDIVLEITLPTGEIVKIIIEIHGPQHLRQIYNWRSPTKQILYDCYKMVQAWKQGYKIILINQEEVWANKFDWRSKLKESINYLTENSEHDLAFVTCSSDLENQYTRENIKEKCEIFLGGGGGECEIGNT